MRYDDFPPRPELDHTLVDAMNESISLGTYELPLLPEAAQKVLAETEKPSWDAAKVVDIIKRDAGLAANLLARANSVAFRGSSQVTSLQQAIGRLGAMNLRQVALVIACETKVFTAKGFEPELRAVFRHSLTTALIARDLARARRANVEEAFLAGLLHDVGYPILLHTLSTLATKLKLAPPREHLLAWAKANHPIIAPSLAFNWGLSEKVAAAMSSHHDAQVTDPLAATLVLADQLARFGAADPTVTHDAVHHHPTVSTLNFYPDTVENLLREAPLRWDEAGA